MSRARGLIKVCFLVLLLAAGDAATAFKLRPHSTPVENRVRYLQQSWLGSVFDSTSKWVTGQFTSPVHEEITQRIWGCNDAEAQACLAPLPFGRYAPRAVLFGVQWNDNPPFALTSTKTKACRVRTTIRLPNFSECWITLFKDASKRAGRGEHFDHRSDVALLYRVHFGDMQFLHAMASWDGEKMGDTKERIMAWAELAYKTATGEIPKATPVSNVSVPRVARLFKGKGYSLESLFTRGVPEYRSNVDLVALGSLMHMVEDSFASGHVTRDEPTGGDCPVYRQAKKAGRVLAFHSFTRQDPGKHGREDSRAAFEAHFISQTANAVTVGRALRRLYDARRPWTEVSAFLGQCVFEVAEDDLDQVAGPGQEFEAE